jgi:hypothetical protein
MIPTEQGSRPGEGRGLARFARRSRDGQGSRAERQGRRALREAAREGESKEKAARIANTPRSTAGKRGGRSPSYEEWSKKELQDRARDLGIEGRSKMDKGELIDALRNH